MDSQAVRTWCDNLSHKVYIFHDGDFGECFEETVLMGCTRLVIWVLWLCHWMGMRNKEPVWAHMQKAHLLQHWTVTAHNGTLVLLGCIPVGRLFLLILNYSHPVPLFLWCSYIFDSLSAWVAIVLCQNYFDCDVLSLLNIWFWLLLTLLGNIVRLYTFVCGMIAQNKRQVDLPPDWREHPSLLPELSSYQLFYAFDASFFLLAFSVLLLWVVLVCALYFQRRLLQFQNGDIFVGDLVGLESTVDGNRAPRTEEAAEQQLWRVFVQLTKEHLLKARRPPPARLLQSSLPSRFPPRARLQAEGGPYFSVPLVDTPVSPIPSIWKAITFGWVNRVMRLSQTIVEAAEKEEVWRKKRRRKPGTYASNEEEELDAEQESKEEKERRLEKERAAANPHTPDLSPLNRDDMEYLRAADQTRHLYLAFGRIWGAQLLKHRGGISSTTITTTANTARQDASAYQPLGHDSASLSRGQRMQAGREEASMLAALLRLFGPSYWLLGLFKFVCDAISFTGPVLLGYVVQFVESQSSSEPQSLYRGLGLAAGMVGGSLLSAVLGSQYQLAMQRLSLRVRTALLSRIYEKSLSLSPSARAQFTVGKITNIFSVDTGRVQNICVSFHEFWSLPFQIGLALYLLHQQLGAALLGGLGVILFMMPVNFFLSKRIGAVSTVYMKQKDARIEVLQEMLSNVRMVKLWGLEHLFVRRIEACRAAETASLATRKYLDAWCVYFWATTPILISLSSFSFYTYLGHALTASKVFTSLALFNSLVGPLNAFPWVVNGLVEGRVSYVRLRELLIADNKERVAASFAQAWHVPSTPASSSPSPSSFSRGSVPRVSISPPSLGETDHAYPCRGHCASQASSSAVFSPPSSSSPSSFSALAVSVRNCVFDYNASTFPSSSPPSPGKIHGEPSSLDQFQLRVPSLDISRGSLVGVFGAVGSGKSSFLRALLGELRLLSAREMQEKAEGIGGKKGSVTVDKEGCVLVPGRLALVSQTPCIFSGTLRSNILFGLTMSPVAYFYALFVTGLVPDLMRLPAKDYTILSEQGGNLSGGQRTRIMLCRAVYANAHTYFLDDPLSAVDEHVVHHVIEHCLGERGALHGKTVLLVTHSSLLFDAALLPVAQFIEVTNNQLKITYPISSTSSSSRAVPFSSTVKLKGNQTHAETKEAEEAAAAGGIERAWSFHVESAFSSLAPSSSTFSSSSSSTQSVDRDPLPVQEEQKLRVGAVWLHRALHLHASSEEKKCVRGDVGDETTEKKGDGNREENAEVAAWLYAQFQEEIKSVFGIDLQEEERENSEVHSDDEQSGEEEEKKEGSDERGVTDDEVSQIGVVEKRVLATYFRFIGSLVVFIIFVALVLMQASKNANDFWLSHWINATAVSPVLPASSIHDHNITMVTNSRAALLPSPSAMNSNTSCLLTHCFSVLHPLSLATPFTAAHSLFGSSLASPSPSFSSFSIPSSPPPPPSPSLPFNSSYMLRGLVIISFINSVCALYRAFSFAYGGLRACKRLFHRLLHAVVFASIDFFDATPTGRILNRFTSDMDAIDDSIPFIFNIFLAQLFTLLGTLMVVSYTIPYVLLLIPPLAWIYYHLQRYYRASSRELRRLDSTSRSPIFCQFAETLAGVQVIRASGREGLFMNQFLSVLDYNQRVVYTNIGCSQWLAFRLQCLGLVVIGFVTTFSVLQSHFYPTALSATFVGLALSYILPLTGNLSGLLSAFTETEREMIGVERCVEYMEVPADGSRHLRKKEEYNMQVKIGLHEPRSPANSRQDLRSSLLESKGSKSASKQPVKKVTFQDQISASFPKPQAVRVSQPENEEDVDVALEFSQVTLHYGYCSTPALSDLSFRVFRSEKIGIVGRTGAGKSSLIQVLAHMRDVSEGSIFLNGWDTRQLRVQDVRAMVLVVPQTSVLFGGTLRENLDPFDRFTDAEIWAVLRQCKLEERIQALSSTSAASESSSSSSSVLTQERHETKRGLETVFRSNEECGLSAGHKQLLCLARAILHLDRQKILVLDEATANVDVATERVVQAVLQTVLMHCTVLIIAHRLSTLHGCDRVMVLEGGRLAEFDKPAVLLSNAQSMFAQLSASQEAADQLATEHHASAEDKKDDEKTEDQ